MARVSPPMEVFVYGTLTDPDRAGSVLDEYEYRHAAVLEGLGRVDGAYPTLAPGGRVRGRVLRTDDVATLDAYEGVDRGLYVRVSVPVAADGSAGSGHGRDTPATVETYVGDPDALDAPASWPGEETFAERVREYVRSHAVRVRPGA